MKELSIEEKAKAYDEALKVLRKYDGANIIFSQSLKEEMFPELKENRDEKVKKSINRLIRYYHDVNFPTPEGFSRKDLLDWIEKRGEQESANWLQELEDKLANATPKQLAEWKEKYFKEEPAEWSEEDEDILNTIINHFKIDIECTDEDDVIRWLKSLRPQSTWKPSDYELEVLRLAAEKDGTCLMGLYEQLKKL